MPEPFWLCQVGGTADLCGNISRLVPSIGDGSNSQLFTTYFGRYPILDYGPKTTAGIPSWCNGGIPQLANLSVHAERMRIHLDTRLAYDYEGLIVIDYESWWPSWGALTSELYRNASRALARSQLPPDASDEQVETKAASDFNASSVAFFAFTTSETKRLRPGARVGWYAGTATGSVYWRYEPSVQSSVHEAQLAWWSAVDVIMPSLYLPYSSSAVPGVLPANLSTYVRRMLATAMQVNEVLRAHGREPKPIVPYTWYRYHKSSAPGALELLSDADAAIELFDAQLRRVASQAVLWGHEDDASASSVLGWFERHAGQFGGLGLRSARSERATNTAEAPKPQRPLERQHHRNAGRSWTGASPSAPVAHPVAETFVVTPPIDPHGSVPPWKECSL